VVQADSATGLPVEYLANLAGGPAFGLQPLVPLKLSYSPITADLTVRLSPHAVQRRHGGELVWEDVSVAAHVRTYGPLAEGIIAALAGGTSAAALATQLSSNPREVRQCLELLLCAGVASDDSESLSPRLMWSAREAWLHAQTALWRSDRPIGGTFPFREKMPSPSARSRPPKVPQIALLKGELPLLTLQAALEQRRSCRSGKQGLDLRRLGLLLHHSARVTAFESGGEYEVRRHPYPTGGGLGELEIYPLISGCAGVDAGLYHYDSFDHALTRIEDDRRALAGISAHASSATASADEHHAVLFVTGRMTRSFWKYEGIGYTLTLRNVGALIQTVALVATALEIATCPIGLLPAQQFATTSGTDAWDEALVGGIAING
jgi:SagB-type dehydrogenase family enzyme